MANWACTLVAASKFAATICTRHKNSYSHLSFWAPVALMSRTRPLYGRAKASGQTMRSDLTEHWNFFGGISGCLGQGVGGRESFYGVVEGSNVLEPKWKRTWVRPVCCHPARTPKTKQQNIHAYMRGFGVQPSRAHPPEPRGRAKLRRGGGIVKSTIMFLPTIPRLFTTTPIEGPTTPPYSGIKTPVLDVPTII